MKNQRILLINKSLVIGGIERVLITQYNSLKENNNVDIFLYKDIIQMDIILDDSLFFLNKYNSLKDFIKIQELTQKYDLIICHAQSERICNDVKSLNYNNTLFVIHGMQSKKLLNGNFIARYLRKKRKQFLYKNQNLISVSNAVKTDIESTGVKAKKNIVIYNPFDINYIRDMANKTVDNIITKEYLVWVGRVSDVKNIPLLIDIYKHLSDKYELVIIGDGDMNLFNTKEKLNIIFLGFQSNPYPYIKNASALLVTSKDEGFGLVLIESLLLNTPVFGVNIPAIKELLLNFYPLGLLPDNIINQASHIKRNINEPIDIHKIEKEFNISSSNNKYLNY